MDFDDTLGEAAFRAEVGARPEDGRAREKMPEMLEQLVRCAPGAVPESERACPRRGPRARTILVQARQADDRDPRRGLGACRGELQLDMHVADRGASRRNLCAVSPPEGVAARAGRPGPGRFFQRIARGDQ